MKRLAAAAALVVLMAGAATAVILPLRIAFQGKLLDPATNQPRNGVFTVTFRIYDAAASGNLRHTETQSVSVVNGVFGTHLGTAALLTADLFSGASAYVSVEVDGNGEMTPRQPLSMAAYAFTSMQMASDGSIRINPGITYSTFTNLGNLQMQYGVAATTLSASAQGNAVYSIFSSSGLFMSSGTLRLGPGSRGVDATGTGVVASTGVFLGAGDGVYSIVTSSGIEINGGTLLVDATGGILATYGVVASTGRFRSGGGAVYGLHVDSGVYVASGTVNIDGPDGLDVRYGIRAGTFTGVGADLVGTTPQVSNSSGSATFTLTANTEVVVISTNIAPLRNNKTVLLVGFVQVNRVANAVATCTARYRFNTAGACGTGSTPLYAYTFTVANQASNAALAPVLAQHAPTSTADISYCLTLVCNAAHSYTTRSLNLMTAAP